MPARHIKAEPPVDCVVDGEPLLQLWFRCWAAIHRQLSPKASVTAGASRLHTCHGV